MRLAAPVLLSPILLLLAGCARAPAPRAPAKVSGAPPTRLPAKASPATAPSPVDLSSPRAAVLSFLTGIYTGDADAALASCLGTDEQRELLRKAARAFAAVQRVKGDYEKRFGGKLELPGFPSNTDDFAGGVAGMTVTEHGDEAKVGPALKVRKQGDQWKVLPGPLTDQWAANVPLLDAIATTTTELADELQAGKFATKEEFDRAVEAKLEKVQPDAE